MSSSFLAGIFKISWPWPDGVLQRADGVCLEKGVSLEDGSSTWEVVFPSINTPHKVLIVCETSKEAKDHVDEKWPIAEWYMKLLPWSPDNNLSANAAPFGDPPSQPASADSA